MAQLMLEGFMEQPSLRRRPTLQELNLIEHLINLASISINQNWKELILVEPLSDGGMGSLHLYPNGKIHDDRIFGEQKSDIMFKDKDGIEVIASLYLDQLGDIFEIDIWKTDFSPTISLDFDY